MTRHDDGRIGLIAGGGHLPVEILQSLNRQGLSPYLVLIDGEADDLEIFRSHDHVRLPLEEFGRLVPLLKAARVTRLVMAGSVARRPVFRNVKWTWSLLGFLPRLAKALASGDDVLLRTVIGHLEAHGIKIVGVHEIVPDLVAGTGAIAVRKPDASEMRDVRAAAVAARAIGALDIGQAAVAIGGRAIALEGIEGTEGLLDRVAAMRGHGRLAGRTGGVLVKCAKPGQELRVDLPTIGPDTVSAAFAAGLTGIALDAGRALILDCASTMARANDRGLFIYGLKGDE
ncbi:UDP-2,3-diacylglucosamine diphosphatase LpxI [Aliihoeflea aestuarii]|jgi:UDP-2,3-diacylglucosamine hydrolase|uniref:LpxI family protein n=1 Tax=Aliihoeflea aestuarii TaxID=453840 RepID=UPI002093BE50|nr:UDP-2,3-diacylglucosamine diphosphatase LpxI [Aliihoeflea aestuarii]MCO6390387.1 UDP-2,3-diacylglucosamine diphosphatase LpxI [Aliihoeflea aestuarii]